MAEGALTGRQPRLASPHLDGLCSTQPIQTRDKTEYGQVGAVRCHFPPHTDTFRHPHTRLASTPHLIPSISSPLLTATLSSHGIARELL